MGELRKKASVVQSHLRFLVGASVLQQRIVLFSTSSTGVIGLHPETGTREPSINLKRCPDFEHSSPSLHHRQVGRHSLYRQLNKDDRRIRPLPHHSSPTRPEHGR